MNNYSLTKLKSLAQNDPKELARVLTSPNTEIHSITSGAELLGGEVIDEEIVLPTLRQLLKHIHAVVREGAMVGVSSFYMEKKPPQDILEKLQAIAASDPSPILKEFASTLLKDFEALP